VAREESQIMELAAAGFEMGAACFLVSELGALEKGGGAKEGAFAMLGIKPERAHQGVGGIADLGQRDQRVFPPEDVRFGVPGTSG
jgi:hypothetical protein